MNQRLMHVQGVLAGDPFPYTSAEEPQEIYLAKFTPDEPLTPVEGHAVTELYLNLGSQAPDVAAGDRLTVTGSLSERQMVTRSGKIRRGGVYQIFVTEWSC